MRSEDRAISLADDRLVVAAAQADSSAFAAIYKRHVTDVYRYVMRRTGNPDLSEDLTAETFERAFGAIGRYEWRGAPLISWLLRIAERACTDWYRNPGRKREGSSYLRITDTCVVLVTTGGPVPLVWPADRTTCDTEARPIAFANFDDRGMAGADAMGGATRRLMSAQFALDRRRADTTKWPETGGAFGSIRPPQLGCQSELALKRGPGDPRW